MKTLLWLVCFLSVFTSANAQILRVATTPSAIANQVLGYNQVSSIATKTYSYTPSVPFAPPIPIDEDSTTEDDLLYNY